MWDQVLSKSDREDIHRNGYLYVEERPNGSLQHEDDIHCVVNVLYHEKIVVLVEMYGSCALDNHMDAWLTRDHSIDL